MICVEATTAAPSAHDNRQRNRRNVNFVTPFKFLTAQTNRRLNSLLFVCHLTLTYVVVYCYCVWKWNQIKSDWKLFKDVHSVIQGENTFAQLWQEYCSLFLCISLILEISLGPRAHLRHDMLTTVGVYHKPQVPVTARDGVWVTQKKTRWARLYQSYSFHLNICCGFSAVITKDKDHTRHNYIYTFH